MKRIIFLLFISTTVFAQTPRLKFRQIQKDTTQGSIAISNPADSQLVFSRDFYISYGIDTVLILYGDTLAATSGIISSVLSDGVTITGNGTIGSELKVDTATVISTIQGLVDTLTARGYLTANQTITLSGDVTGSGTTAITATVVDDSHDHIISNVDFLQDSLDAKANDSDLANYVTLSGTETITGAKTFTNTFTQSGGDANFDNNTLYVDATNNRVGIGTSLPTVGFNMEISGSRSRLALLNTSDNTSSNYSQILFGNGIYAGEYAHMIRYNDTKQWSIYNGGGDIFFSTLYSGGFRYDFFIEESNGNVGIGTSTPTQPLDIVTGANEGIVFGSTSNSTLKEGGLLMRHYNTAEEDVLGFYAATTSSVNNIIFGGGASALNAATAIYFYTAANNTTLNGSLRMTIDGSGNIGAPSGTNIYNASDVRLKRNIANINNGLSSLLKLNPVSFMWKEGFVESEENKTMLGFIAQEVVDAVPEAVEYFGTDVTINGEVISSPLRVNEKFLIPITVKAIQEQQEQIETQQQKITDLEAIIQALITRIENLENK